MLLINKLQPNSKNHCLLKLDGKLIITIIYMNNQLSIMLSCSLFAYLDKVYYYYFCYLSFIIISITFFHNHIPSFLFSCIVASIHLSLLNLFTWIRYKYIYIDLVRRIFYYVFKRIYIITILLFTSVFLFYYSLYSR